MTELSTERCEKIVLQVDASKVPPTRYDYMRAAARYAVAEQAAEITRLKAKNERLRVLVDSQKRWLWDMSIKHNDGARFIAEQCGAQCDELAQALAAIAQTTKAGGEL